MKILKFLLLLLMLVIIIAGVVSLFLPDEGRVERATVIQAPAAKVFTYVNSLKAFNNWSPWADMDPNMQYTYSGPEEGVGAVVEWASSRNEVDKGRQEIVESRPAEYVKTQLEFGMGPAEAEFFLTPNNVGTEVRWSFYTYFDGPVDKYFGLMLDDWVGQSFDQGLGNLKTLVEEE